MSDKDLEERKVVALEKIASYLHTIAFVAMVCIPLFFGMSFAK